MKGIAILKVLNFNLIPADTSKAERAVAAATKTL